MDDLYARTEEACGDGSFYHSMLRVMNTEWSISERELSGLPREGGLIIVANHPFGLIDGLILGSMVETVRDDYRVIANQLLDRFPRVAANCILVDPFGEAGSKHSNRVGLRQSLAWLRNGGILILFPAGEVSSFGLRRRAIADPAWNKNVARLAMVSQVPVLPMYIEGRNSLSFQAAGLVHPRLRTALLCREFLNKTNKKITIRVGNLISLRKLESFASDEERIDYLRRKTYVLAHRQEKSPLPFLFVPSQLKQTTSPVAASGEQAKIVAATDSALMRAEIEKLDPACLLHTQGTQRVFVAEANCIPNVVREIGRLREITFREAGEGTGQPIDLDQFDSHYLHLFLWNDAHHEIVGAYRLGQSDRILNRLGKQGFYTSTLFSYRREFLERITPALELGRSFVRVEYQKSYAPLLSLWRGVGEYVRRHPQYRILFGPVSISNNYLPSSRQFMVTFMKEYCKADDLAHFVRARNPFRSSPLKSGMPGLDTDTGIQTVWDIEALSALIADIEVDQKGVPILLRQYLKLGGKLLGFNLDRKFSNALDGLIVVDLLKTDRRLLDRYLGENGAEEFLLYHQQRIAQAR